MTLDKYLEKIAELRDKLRQKSDAAWRMGTCVGSDFYAAQDELMRTIRNCRSWCKRHGLGEVAP